MSLQQPETNVSSACVAKHSKCKTDSVLEACQVPEEAKYEKSAVEHIDQAEDSGKTLEETILNISDQRRKLLAQNKESINSLGISQSKLEERFQTLSKNLSKDLQEAYETNLKAINDLTKIYEKKNEDIEREYTSLENNQIYKKSIDKGEPYPISKDSTELEVKIERIQYFLREQSSDNDVNAGKQFRFEFDNENLDFGELITLPNGEFIYEITPRQLTGSTPGQYADIEQRIARVTDSKQSRNGLSSVLNDPSATREARMEAVARIAVCQFNCRIFGGYVRDWIVGGYSAKPSTTTNSSRWIIYTDAHDDDNDDNDDDDNYDDDNGDNDDDNDDVVLLPHVVKAFVPNGIDCFLPDSDFDIDEFVTCLRTHGIECGDVCKIKYGYVLLLDERRSPFTMDLIFGRNAHEVRRYNRLDLNVNSLYVKKDAKNSLGLRCYSTANPQTDIDDLETIVEHIQEKKFRILRGNCTDVRVKKMLKRGWTRLNDDKIVI